MEQIRIPFEYFYGNQPESFQFFRIPKAMVHHPYFKPLSNDAKLLYGLFLDRAALSYKNGWLDDYGRVYIVYTVASICEDLNCATGKVEKMMKELESFDLLERKRRGQGQPSLLYPKTFFQSLPPAELYLQIVAEKKSRLSEIENQDFPDSTVLNPEPQNSKLSGSEELQLRKTQANDTEFNDTEESYNHPSDLNERYRGYLLLVKENILFDETMQTLSSSQAELYEEMFYLILDVVCVPRSEIRIGGAAYPSEMVRSRFLKLTRDHLLYVMECVGDRMEAITNMRAYLLSALYSAPTTMNHYYQNRVQSDRFAPPPEDTTP